ncbi:MAG: hypothetical protein ACRC10_03600 [Thermoguttaceae bacterium]
MNSKQQRLMLTVFLLIAVLAPVAFGFLFFFALLLTYFNDAVSVSLLNGFGAAFLLLWIVDLFGLLFFLGLQQLFQDSSSTQEQE